MNKLIVVLMSFVSFIGFTQTSKNMEKEVNEIFSDLGEYVKHRDKAINYHANIYIGAVNFELLINDFPVQKFYRPADGAMSTSIPINTAILKPGKQTWKIKVYPSFTFNFLSYEHKIIKVNWHAHLAAATRGTGHNNFYSLGSFRKQPEDYMKTKIDTNGNAIT